VIGDFLTWIQSSLQRLGHAFGLRLREEPVLTLQVVQAGAAMAVGFGLGWSGEQVALFVTIMAALLGWVARREVTPNVNVPEPQEDPDPA